MQGICEHKKPYHECKICEKDEAERSPVDRVVIKPHMIDAGCCWICKNIRMNFKYEYSCDVFKEKVEPNFFCDEKHFIKVR